MTDDHLDPLDELASAHLDGLTTADEDARIAADPDLRRRVAAMQAVRDALREPPPAVPPSVRDAAIAAAVAQAAAADDLRTARARRASRRPLGRRALGVAAALVLLALAVPLLVSLDGDDEETANVATGDASEAAGDGPEAVPERHPYDRAEGGAAAEEDAGATDQASGPVGGAAASRAHLGRFGDLAELEAAVRDRASEQSPLSGPSPATSGTGEAPHRELCEAPDTLEPGSAVVFVAEAVVGGRAVVVAVVEASDGSRSMQVVTAGPPCELVAERRLEG